MKSFIGTMALALVYVACGSNGSGSGSGGGSDNGSVNGKSVVDFSDSVYFSDNGNDLSQVSTIGVTLTNYGTGCSFSSGSRPSGTWGFLEFTVSNSNSSIPLATGAFSVVNVATVTNEDQIPAQFATAVYGDSSGGSGFGSSGTITLSSLTSSNASGSYNITLGSTSDPNVTTGTLTGSFNANYCTEAD